MAVQKVRTLAAVLDIGMGSVVLAVCDCDAPLIRVQLVKMFET